MSAAALDPALTLICALGKREKIDAKYLVSIARFVRRLLDTDFGGVQRRAELALGLSQSHLSQLLRGPRGNRGPGLHALIKLHEATKASLDEILGISRPDPIEERVSRLERHVAERPAHDARRRDTAPPKRSTVRPRRAR